MSQSGVFVSGEVLDISAIYEMAIFTDATLSTPLKIMCSNNDVWCEYGLLKSQYLYLADLMANYIRVDSAEPITLHYNANLKK